MRRILCYAAILALVLALPVEKSDVGKLRPVEVVSIYKEGKLYVMQTDTADQGVGTTAQQALESLKATSSGIIYLDTAEFLLLSEGAEDAAEELRQQLKSSVRLCRTEEPVDLPKAAKFLSVHGDLPSLKEWETGTQLPLLSTFGDSLIFLKKVENNA